MLRDGLPKSGRKLPEAVARALAPTHAEVVYDPDTGTVPFDGGRKFDLIPGIVALNHRR